MSTSPQKDQSANFTMCPKLEIRECLTRGASLELFSAGVGVKHSCGCFWFDVRYKNVYHELVHPYLGATYAETKNVSWPCTQAAHPRAAGGVQEQDGHLPIRARLEACARGEARLRSGVGLGVGFLKNKGGWLPLTSKPSQGTGKIKAKGKIKGMEVASFRNPFKTVQGFHRHFQTKAKVGLNGPLQRPKTRGFDAKPQSFAAKLTTEGL